MHYLIALIVFITIAGLLILLVPLLAAASSKKPPVVFRVVTLPWWLLFYLIAFAIAYVHQRKAQVGAQKPFIENELLTAAFYWSGFTFQVQ